MQREIAKDSAVQMKQEHAERLYMYLTRVIKSSSEGGGGEPRWVEIKSLDNEIVFVEDSHSMSFQICLVLHWDDRERLIVVAVTAAVIVWVGEIDYFRGGIVFIFRGVFGIFVFKGEIGGIFGVSVFGSFRVVIRGEKLLEGEIVGISSVFVFGGIGFVIGGIFGGFGINISLKSGSLNDTSHELIDPIQTTYNAS
ncbi:hypothetical protein NL676_000276 [Syzygium grande]|nr:hypothetical protein NL676_000276 [Syzygium grande]